MQNTKRQQNSIITYFAFYLILTIVLMYIILQVIYPAFVVIKNKKQEALDTYNSIQTLHKTGVSFSDFTNISKGIIQGAYTKEVLKNIEKDFFNANFINTGNEAFELFIQQKNDDINKSDNIAIRTQKEEKISTILPSYSENFIDGDSSILTDFEFINYVESLLETFHLSHSDPIGIKTVVLLTDFEESATDSSLGNNIFYIPLKLSLTGSKSNIISFLHYVENVGKITIKNDDIEIYNDIILTKGTNSIVLGGEQPSKNYNIYEHQVMDIESITMKDYIDGTYLKRGKNEKLEDFIIKTQANEKFDIDVTLRFYVKGLQYYKIEETIKRFLNTHALIKGLATNGLKNINQDQTKILNFKKINNYLKEIDNDIVFLKKAFVKKENLEDVYKKAMTYDSIFYNLLIQTGLEDVILDLEKKYNTQKSEQEVALQNTVLSEEEKLKIQKHMLYTESLQGSINALQRAENEEKGAYVSRIYNKNTYDEVMYLHFLLDNNK